MKAKELGKILLFNAVLMLVIILIAEVFARSVFDNKFLLEGNQYVFFEFDKTLGWVNKPDISGQFKRGEEFDVLVQTNSKRMRDKEYTLKKPKGITRIAILGDSFSWGFGVTNDQLWSAILEEKLGKNFEVLNFGVSGYGRGQQLLQLTKEVYRFSPDIVLVLAYPGNDLYDNLADDPKVELYPRPHFGVDENNQLEVFGLPLSEPKGNFEERFFMRHTGSMMRYYSRSYLFRVFYHILHSAKKSWEEDPSGYLNDIFLVDKKDKLLEQLKVEKAILKKMKKDLHQKNISLYFAIASTTEQVRQSRQDELTKRFPRIKIDWYQPSILLEQAANDLDIPVFNLIETLKQHEDQGQMMHNKFEFHWSLLGNKVVGEALVPWIRVGRKKMQLSPHLLKALEHGSQHAP